MKIAFVGKGGAGKSTLAALMTDYLAKQGWSVLLLDADINMHMGPMLGVDVDLTRYVSLPDNRARVRQHLLGDNKHIGAAERFIKTTPPGLASHIIRDLEIDPVIREFSQKIGDRIRLMTVGTYDTETIGVSCYHGNLAIAENIVSHTHFENNQALVCDMVAGTDAFSGSLHLQFDCLFLVVEPTAEGVEVFNQYRTLATAANVFEHVFVIGNKVDDEDDVKFLRDHVGDKLIAWLPNLKALRKARQAKSPVSVDLLSDLGPFTTLLDTARTHQQDPDERLRKLHALHTIHAQEDYIVARHGDIRDQIDPGFSYKDVCQS